MGPYTFAELNLLQFDEIRVEHEAITELDYRRIGIANGEYAPYNKVLAGLFMFTDEEMKSIFSTGKWYRRIKR